MKPLPNGSYIVRPFKTYKSHLCSYTWGGSSNPIFISIDEATVPTAAWRVGTVGQGTNANSEIAKTSLFASIQQMFYPPSESSISPQFDRHWAPSQSISGAYVISVSEYSFGEQIRPGTFHLTTTNGTASISDDGNGRLYCSTNPSGTVGNIFYPFGIAVVEKMFTTSSITGSVINQQGLYFDTGSNISVAYKSQLTLYEHSVICTLEKNEFNFSTNASLSMFQSSSISGSGLLMDMFASGTLTPYITTIGLYNSVNELVAIAKVPRPIRRAPEIDQSFIIKLDI